MDKEVNEFFRKSDNFVADIMKHRKALFIISVLAFIISCIVSLLLPVKFKATTVLFAAQSNNVSKSLIDAENFDTKDYLAFGDDKNSEQMMQLLKSADVMYSVAKKFDLYDYYGISNKWDRNYLLKGYYDNNFQFDITEYQSIRVTVFDKNAQKAADMANGVVQIADSLYKQVILQRARVSFDIVKHQYDSSKVVLKTLQDSMDFYRRQGLLSYDYQVKELTRGYSDAEVKGNPSDIKTMEDKLKAFADYGRGYWDLYNALQDQYKWMLQLKQAYMEAKANMDRTIPPFFVVEEAVKPDKRALPVRWLVVLISTLAAFFFGLVFLLVYKKLHLIKPKTKEEV